MSVERICNILGNGNEYYTGTEIMDQLHTAGFKVVESRDVFSVRKKPTPCPVCGLVFKGLQGLKVHISTVHK